MRTDIKRRLENIESKYIDHISRLKVIDYIGGIEDYHNDDWQEESGTF